MSRWSLGICIVLGLLLNLRDGLAPHSAFALSTWRRLCGRLLRPACWSSLSQSRDGATCICVPLPSLMPGTKAPANVC